MPTKKATALSDDLKKLPSVDEVLRSEVGSQAARTVGDADAAKLARRAIAELREVVRASRRQRFTEGELLDQALARMQSAWFREQTSGVRRVINATGVVIHTNLGRAPLPDAARERIVDAAGYASVEFDVETGKRGRRGRRAEDLIVELTGAQDALVVNNCAAAAFFVLTAFASGGEVVISRGELVEIGGDFRVPDVLKQSGAALREVGTTNRTKLADYEKAIGRKTRMILRVHPSNYRIVGFTATPSVAELASLTKKRRLILYEDIGSGALTHLSSIGLGDEPVAAQSLADGAHIVTFSGDKLLGGPQAGIIAGRKSLIEKLRKHPLYRALRADKLVYAGLEATLECHRRAPLTEVPVLRSLTFRADEIGRRAEALVKAVKERTGRKSGLLVETVAGRSAVGGGAAPTAQLATVLVAASHRRTSTPRLEQLLRMNEPPIVTRIVGNRVMVDLRTVSEKEEAELIAALARLA